MNDEIRQALFYGPDATMADRTVDITTTGRRSGEPRRIETVFYRYGDDIYLSGLPMPKPRAWLLNLAAEPHFTFHLKHGVSADLDATATVISDPQERRGPLTDIAEAFAARWTADSPWPKKPLEDWLEHAPLAKVSFDQA